MAGTSGHGAEHVSRCDKVCRGRVQESWRSGGGFGDKVFVCACGTLYAPVHLNYHVIPLHRNKFIFHRLLYEVDFIQLMYGYLQRNR